VRLAPDRRRLGVLLVAGAVLGALSGVVGLILALGHNTHTIFGDQFLASTSTNNSLLRVAMPGLGIGFMLLWLLTLWLIRGRWPRWVWIVCVTWILVDIVISQTRDLWVIGVLALVLVMLVAGPRVRGRLVIALVLVAAVIAIVVAVPQGGGTGSTPLSPIVARAGTILNPQALSKSSSATDRDYEDRNGWRTAKHHLAIGIGPGVPYGATVGTGSGAAVGVTPRLFLQNQYLYLLLITGIPGVAAWILFLLATMRNAWTAGAPVESRMLGIGVLAQALTAILILSYTDSGWLTALGLVAGAIFLLRPQAGMQKRYVQRASA
jgi:O-antigen ligase